ncbi:MAG TPA: hypothetical protein DDX19_03920 [Rhodopirellula baltica]|nr:hypothetical protein [Rhodopirellula baltica]
MFGTALVSRGGQGGIERKRRFPWRYPASRRAIYGVGHTSFGCGGGWTIMRCHKIVLIVQLDRPVSDKAPAARCLNHATF